MIIEDEKYMRRCIQLASNGWLEARPNPMVGAVIVCPSSSGDGGRIIGEGYHVRCGEGHAEVNAFASVSPEDKPLLKESTIYVSLEPCAHYGKTPPCCDLIISKGIRRVVVGCVDPFAKVQGRGIQRIREAGIEVTVGVLEKECQWLNRRFFTFHKKHRPYIILKWAQTDNGFIDDHGHPLAISSPFTKMLVHQQRAREDAIVVGRLTAEKEQPQLNVREWSGPSPVRFVLSRKEEYFGNLITVKSIDDLLATCYERQLQSLIVEGGLTTLQSFLNRGLWDELRVEKAPLTVDNGTPAPTIPAEAQAFSEECYDGRKIIRFRAPSF